MSLRRKLAQFRTKPASERRLAIEAAFYLAVARLLLVYVPFRRIAPRLARQPRDAREADPATRADIRRAVTTAARHVAWNAACLPQAIAAKFMLARRGCKSTLRLGVGRNEAGAFAAHAWLEAGDGIVVGEASVEQMTPIAEL